MEHLRYFDLPADPFQNEADARFYFESAPQKRARLRILRGIHQRKALSVLVGGPGLGKTTLAHAFLRELAAKEYAAHYLSIPHEACASGWFLPNVARVFGVQSPAEQIHTLVDQIHAQLAAVVSSKRAPVLLVDEAQLFRNRDAMEEFRGLLNLVHGGRKLLTLVLFGLPELGEILKLDPALAQRVEIRVELAPMDWLESQAYVAHRLRLAGATQAVFAPDALEALFRWSGGVPRVLNTLADNALFEAYLAEAKPVDSSIVATAAEALGLVASPVEDPYPSMPGIVPTHEPAARSARPALADPPRPKRSEAQADWLEPLAPMPADLPELAVTETTFPAELESVVAQDTEPTLEPELVSPDHLGLSGEGHEFELDEVVAEQTAPPAATAIVLDTEPEPEAALEIAAEPETDFEIEPIAAAADSSEADAVADELELAGDEPELDDEPALDDDSISEPPEAISAELELGVDNEDSSWNLGALVREGDAEDNAPLLAPARNEDSFDLRSLVDEIEPRTQRTGVARPSPAAKGPTIGKAPAAARPPAAAAKPATPAPKPAPAAPAAPEKDEDDLDALFDEIQIGD